MKHIRICKDCKTYTMKEICAVCNEKTSSPIPPKYSPEDKYGKYRRMSYEQERIKEGLL